VDQHQLLDVLSRLLRCRCHRVAAESHPNSSRGVCLSDVTRSLFLPFHHRRVVRACVAVLFSLLFPFFVFIVHLFFFFLIIVFVFVFVLSFDHVLQHILRKGQGRPGRKGQAPRPRLWPCSCAETTTEPTLASLVHLARHHRHKRL
jgi:hypothetical protein